jgi:hypothetical protein
MEPIRQGPDEHHDTFGFDVKGSDLHEMAVTSRRRFSDLLRTMTSRSVGAFAT